MAESHHARPFDTETDSDPDPDLTGMDLDGLQRKVLRSSSRILNLTSPSDPESLPQRAR